MFVDWSSQIDWDQSRYDKSAGFYQDDMSRNFLSSDADQKLWHVSKLMKFKLFVLFIYTGKETEGENIFSVHIVKTLECLYLVNM